MKAEDNKLMNRSMARLAEVVTTLVFVVGGTACGSGSGHFGGSADSADASDSAATPDSGTPLTPRDWQHENDVAPTLVAKRLEESVHLDGVLDEQGWQLAQVSSLEDKDPSDGTSDNTMSVRGLWDQDFLYIAAHISDARVEHDASAKPFRTDSVEVFIDSSRDRSPQPNSDDWHLFGLTDGSAFSWRSDATGSFEPADAAPQAAVKETDGGYIIEMRMAFSDLGVQPEQHLRMGLAMAQNDLDDGQLAQYRWTERLSLHNPQTYGDLRLGGETPDDQVPPPKDTSGSQDPPPTASCSSEGAINVVDRGADNTGGQSIDGVLDRLVSPGAKLYFPPGSYKIRSFATSANDITFCGEDAVLFPAGSPRTWLRFSGNGWVIDGFRLDPDRPHNPEPFTWMMLHGDNWEVRNIVVDGRLNGGNRIFLPYVANRSATGTFRNITARHGSPDGVEAYYVNKPHDGTLILDNVDIRNFGGRGIYHSGAAPGTTRILNSYWENNRVNVRLAGRNCVVRNTTIRQTVNKRGPDSAIWLRANSERPVGNVHAEAYGALIEDSELIIDGTNSNSEPDQASAIQIGGGSNGYFGSVHIKNTRILINNAGAKAGVEANNNVDPDGISADPPETHVTVENSQITTDQSIPGIRIDGRDGTVIRGNCIDAGGQPWDINNTSVQTSNNDTSGPCGLPSQQ